MDVLHPKRRQARVELPAQHALDVRAEPRSAVLGKVRCDGRDVWIGSTHPPRNKTSMRAEAASRVLQLLDFLDGPYAFCGDFNQSPERWLPHEHHLVQAPAVPTYPAERPHERIDYCLIAHAIASARTIPSTASDHLPLLVELSLRAAAAA